jgi:hypothetical protein
LKPKIQQHHQKQVFFGASYLKEPIKQVLQETSDNNRQNPEFFLT